MLIRTLALLVCFGLLQGCAISQEGVGISIPSSDKKVQARLEQLKKNAAEQGSSTPGLILVGKASAFRSITERNVARVFKTYVKDAKSIDRTRTPDMTEAKLLQESAGWTKLKFMDYVIAAAYGRALVPKDISEQVNFSSSALTILWQDSGDLVAAVTNSDGVPVIKKLLCREDSSYHVCKREYVKGVFDANTGKEINLGTFAPVENGDVIDRLTYKRRK